MRSRMERYHSDELEAELSVSRSDKNRQLYQDLGKNTKYTNFTDVTKANTVDLEAASKSYRTREGYHQIKDYENFVEKPKVSK